jgi:hypothetical protein
MPNHLDGAGGSWAPSRLRNQGPSDTADHLHSQAKTNVSISANDILSSSHMQPKAFRQLGPRGARGQPTGSLAGGPWGLRGNTSQRWFFGPWHGYHNIRDAHRCLNQVSLGASP